MHTWLPRRQIYWSTRVRISRDYRMLVYRRRRHMRSSWQRLVAEAQRMNQRSRRLSVASWSISYCSVIRTRYGLRTIYTPSPIGVAEGSHRQEVVKTDTASTGAIPRLTNDKGRKGRNPRSKGISHKIKEQGQLSEVTEESAATSRVVHEPS